ncbi:outer membrane transport energization protein TonB [Mucilaginibacter oryzae]|uniref:Outer membrane transport energization protein TonB n=2 Tax=Mucilaginibacter oryzae TaxID=468058 RepID=A0A316HXB9_9SPHI|nr:outer membrane transport energization protein TonB [Mucilaginibacter oryzae]
MMKLTCGIILNNYYILQNIIKLKPLLLKFNSENMLITKFDLYKTEWLDLVFDHRNKNYGAYELRKTYGSTMAKAMGIAFAAVALLSTASIIFKAKPKEETLVKMITVDLTKVMPPPPKNEDRVVEPQKQQAEPVKAAAPTPASTIKYTTPRIVTTEVTTDPPTITDLNKSAVGSETVKGEGTAINVPEETNHGGGNGTGVVEDVGVHTLGETLEVMPEPVGGAAAWAKFLQKNLRFPPAAQDAGVSGRVFMSFIIEKDGTLSNIKVDRGAGYGFDEEATRVLKLAKAWKPGVQNGQNVRVRYSIPISFQLSTEE